MTDWRFQQISKRHWQIQDGAHVLYDLYQPMAPSDFPWQFKVKNDLVSKIVNAAADLKDQNAFREKAAHSLADAFELYQCKLRLNTPRMIDNGGCIIPRPPELFVHHTELVEGRYPESIFSYLQSIDTVFCITPPELKEQPGCWVGVGLLDILAQNTESFHWSTVLLFRLANSPTQQDLVLLPVKEPLLICASAQYQPSLLEVETAYWQDTGLKIFRELIAGKQAG